MKKAITLTFFCLALTIASYSQSLQNKNEQQSNAEKFSETSGTLIQKEFIDIGTIGSTKIQVAVFTDVISGKKSSAVRFEKSAYSSLGSDTKVGVLDADELDGLIKSLKIISDKVFPTIATNYTEVSFVSRGGLSAGCFWGKDKKWSTYIKVEKYDGDSYQFFSKKDDFDNFITYLEKAKTQMI